MKTLIALILNLLLLGFTQVKAAIVVSDITTAEFNLLTSTYDAAWSVFYRGGATSGGASEEIRIARNISTPQSGGGSNTLIGDLTWSSSAWSSSGNTLELLLDNAGNISARANAVTVSGLGFSTVRSFNQILVMVYDDSLFGASDLQSILVNNSSVSNMFADGRGFPGQSDVVSITNFGSQAPFSFNGTWAPGTVPNSNDQYVWVVALNNTTIPEPSSALLIVLSSLCFFKRKR